MIGNRSRKGSVLFDIDSILDLPLGFVITLQEFVMTPGANIIPTIRNVINFSFLEKSIEELKQIRVYEIGLDVERECFLEKSNAIDAFIRVYKETYRKAIVNNAPYSVMNKLIKSYNAYGGGLIDCFVRCNDDIEINSLKNNRTFRSAASLLLQDAAETDLGNYDRIIVGDIHTLDKYDFSKNPNISIAVLNYGNNLQVADNDVIILPNYISKYGRNTSLRVIDSYTDIKEERRNE